MAESDHKQGEGRRPPRRFRFPVKSAVAIAFLVLLALPLSTLHADYYKRYPQLGTRMQNWRTSTHARFSCGSCHIEPGLRGFLYRGTRTIPAFYSQILQGPRQTNLFDVPGRNACQKCHTSYRQVSASGDLLIPHRAHVEVLKVNCADCHKELVHARNEKGFNRPRMTMCLSRCHDGKQATTACTKCHTRKHVPSNHRRKDWLETHSTLTDSVDCGECHGWSPDFCGQCHSKRPRSHSGNWKKAHQFRAKKRGDKGCLTCHEERFCKRCHD
ncbi:MAG: hypothetical protein HY876_04755 [Coriobacteriales bacterium]|nr:hypothetical protein [Coriobacteriales bacterium]